MNVIDQLWPHMILGAIKFPAELVPFWESDVLMNTCRLYNAKICVLSDYQLVGNPVSKPWYAAYVDVGLAFFIIFVLDDNPGCGLPTSTAWMMGCYTMLGEMRHVHQPIQIHFGMDSHNRWNIQFHNDSWYAGTSLVCEADCVGTAFPMILALSTYTRHLSMVRCMSVPENIRHAITCMG